MHAKDLETALPDRPIQRLVDRAAQASVLVASVWFTLAISWGLFGRVAAGHDAVVAARGIIAENMLAWHIGGPVREYTLQRPGPALYYAHHPWGTFWGIAAFAALLGRHAFVPRLFAIVASASTPPLLYGIGRELWSPAAGALAALAYVTLPITLAFGNFPGFEVPLVASCLLTTWGYVRFIRKREYRWMGVSLIGALFCANTDWEAQIFLAVAVGGSSAMALFGPRRLRGQFEPLAVARWSWLAALVAIGTISAYAYYFQHIGAMGDLAAQLTVRTRGNADPLSEVLEARAYWIDVTFTPLAILVGKIALPLFIGRIFFCGRRLEIFPIAIFAMALVHYVKFKNGADVHIYWPLPFAPYYALSVGVIAESAAQAARRLLVSHDRAGWTAGVPAASLTAFAMIPLAILPDGIDALHYARMTGGRFNEKGKLTFREEDKSQALEWLARRMEGPAVVELHDGMRPTWAQAWALHRPIRQVSTVPFVHSNNLDRYFIGDLAFMPAADQLRLAHEFSVVAVGQYVFVDRGIPQAPAQGLVFDEREPNPLEWYLLSGTDPIRSVRADPFYTWELRDHYGQTPNPVPDIAPTSPEQLRIAHNAAVAANDSELSERYVRELMTHVDARAAGTYSNGTKLLGGRYTPGVSPTLALYFLAAGPAEADYHFDVFSIVDKRRFLSLVPYDRKTKSVGATFGIPPRLWRRGYIYVSRSEIRHRPGHELFFGSFSAPVGSNAPRSVDQTDDLPLLVLR